MEKMQVEREVEIEKSTRGGEESTRRGEERA